MQKTAIHELISPIIEATLEAMEYRLVRVMWQGSDKRRILQIMAERFDGVDMTVEDCEEISHTVSALLDVEDPIESAYELEVSSPGIDRPLVNAKDFADYMGHDVRVEMAIAQEGRRRYRGPITQVSDELIVLEKGGERFELPLADMASAKLVLTDVLVKESTRRFEEREKLRLSKM